MGERKVLNNYISPDFDPSIIPRIKRNRDKLVEVRMMLPFSLRCNTCGEYMYRGKKFNSRSEFVTDDVYLGIKKLRFYIKCTNCSAEITFKTDPKNADYECESGASRNFELWRDNEKEREEAEKEREEDQYDPMKELEHRTMDNKVEMDILDALDQIKDINQRHRRVDTEKVLERIANKHQRQDPSNAAQVQSDDTLSAEDEAMLKAIQARQQLKTSGNNSSTLTSGGDGQSMTSGGSRNTFVEQLQQHVTASTSAATSSSSNTKPAVVIVRKRKVAAIEETAVVVSKPEPAPSKPDNSLSLLMDYGDDDEED